MCYYSIHHKHFMGCRHGTTRQNNRHLHGIGDAEQVFLPSTHMYICVNASFQQPFCDALSPQSTPLGVVATAAGLCNFASAGYGHVHDLDVYSETSL